MSNFLPLAKRICLLVTGILKTHYPRFVFGLPEKNDQIPIFVYHEVDKDNFESDLAFLRDNGFRTLTTDEFIRQYKQVRNTKCVLLTFDDARHNFWDIAFPLLKKFNAKATLFVPTYWVGRHIPVNHNQCGSKPISFMKWDELRACSHSGLIDVQSHGHRHALIYKTHRLVTFVAPDLLKHYDIFDWPMRQDGARELLGVPPLGTPTYSLAPLLSASNRLLEDVSIVRACQELVRQTGEKEFFARRDWRDRLYRLHRNMIQRNANFTVMSENAFQSQVLSEFTLSRTLFEAELGKPPGYFAYPWMLGSKFSMGLARERGMKAIFGVGLDFKRARTHKGPLPTFSRIKGDWLRFMPGRGRQDLRTVIVQKLKAIMHNQHPIN